jgi:hypothetical protein
MPSDYRYVLDAAVVEKLLSCPARDRDRFINHFRSLEKEPYQLGESFFNDLSGRQVQRKLFGTWVVSFWSDHAVKEVRIVGVQSVRRQGKAR